MRAGRALARTLRRPALETAARASGRRLAASGLLAAWALLATAATPGARLAARFLLVAWALVAPSATHGAPAPSPALPAAALLEPGPPRTAGTAAEAAARAPQPAPLVSAVGEVGITVGDLARSLDFYTRVLSFEKVSEVEVAGEDYERLQGVFGLRVKVARLRLGSETIELSEYLAPRGRPFPADSRSHDRWFQHIAIIVSDMDRAYRWLRQNDVGHLSAGPQRLPDWNPAAGGIQAFYFRDPDGHPLEILEFPPGKGDPRWHGAHDRLFLGIDHTAIVVSDTEASLRFYREALGMRVAGESENYGPEQERLNNVFGARLRITGLRAGSGPGIEFLQYLSPADGRPAPADTRSNDLVHWQTRLLTADADAAARRLLEAGSRFLSPGAVRLADGALGFRKGLLVRDPDGHAMQLVEQSGPETAGPRPAPKK